MAQKKRDSIVDSIRTIDWFWYIGRRVGAKAGKDMRLLFEAPLLRRDANGEVVRSSKFPLYELGTHVPHRQILEKGEILASGSQARIEHVLWTVLRDPLPSAATNAHIWIRQLSPDVQSLVLSLSGQIRLETGHHYLRALERRRSLDGLAALTILLRLSVEESLPDQAIEYARCLMQILLALGQQFDENGIAEKLFELYVTRVFHQVRWDGLRFSFDNYPYRKLAQALPLLAAEKLMFSHLAGGNEQIDFFVTKILTGQYCPWFKVLSDLMVAPDLDIGPPTSTSCAQMREQIKRRLDYASFVDD